MSDLVVADALEFYRGFEPDSLDASIEDPPAGIGFMGVDFDADRGGRDRWIAWLAAIQRARLEACKPGAHSLTWALPRTSHWTMTALEDAGWQIRHDVPHIHAQGWPKAGRALLKPASERWILARKPLERGLTVEQNIEKWGVGELNIDACRIRRNWDERGEAWKRSGHSAKPGAQKIGGAPAGNGINCHPDGSWPPDAWFSHAAECLEVGLRKVRGSGSVTGDEPSAVAQACFGERARVPFESHAAPDGTETIPAWHCLAACACGHAAVALAGGDPPRCPACGEQQWWACPVAELDAQSGERPSGSRRAGARKGLGYGGATGDGGPAILASSGGASRFFPAFVFHAKAPAWERDLGCEELYWERDKGAQLGWRRVDRVTFEGLIAEEERIERETGKRPVLCAQGNIHPTVKPLGLCAYMANLVRPFPEVVSRPRGANGFCGSGSEAIAARLTGWEWSGCDVSEDAIAIAQARRRFWLAHGRLERPRGSARRRDVEGSTQLSLLGGAR